MHAAGPLFVEERIVTWAGMHQDPIKERKGRRLCMGNLVTFQEILTRYEAGENAFDLTLEKWVKIRESMKNAFTISHYREILGAAMIKVPLCLENHDNCAICPLHAICSRGQEGSFGKFMRAIQAYCIAGDLLPKSPLLGLADQIISELESCKGKSLTNLS
jgi:hypothetical protein